MDQDLDHQKDHLEVHLALYLGDLPLDFAAVLEMVVLQLEFGELLEDVVRPVGLTRIALVR